MDRRKSNPKPGPLSKINPPWRFPAWYFALMLLSLWGWQELFNPFAVRTIPYSEFKTHLALREVVECTVKEEEIVGRIEPKAHPEDNKAPAPFIFRTVRIEDPTLVEELQKGGVKFAGSRPGFLSQFLLAWVLPIGLMILPWTLLSRKFGAAGETILNIGKSKARL